MMNNYILGIESSTNVCLVYILNNDNIIDYFYSDKKNIHDKIIAPKIKELLVNNNLLMGDFKAIAVSSGPGSFTGLRVGTSIAKGICFGSEIKLIPISIFEIIKSLIENKTNSAVVLHSHADLYYFSKYINGWTEIELIKEADILKNNQNLYGILNINKIHLINKENPLNINNLSKVAFEKYKNQEFVDVLDFSPNYHQEFKLFKK